MSQQLFMNTLRTNTKPQGRVLYSITNDNIRSIYIFGGSRIRTQCFNDLWKLILNGSHSRWIQMKINGDNILPRCQSGIVYYRDNLYIFGGFNNVTMEQYRDIYRFDLNRNEWHNIDLVLQCLIIGYLSKYGNIKGNVRLDIANIIHDYSVLLFKDKKDIFKVNKLSMMMNKNKYIDIKNRIQPILFGNNVEVYKNKAYIFGGNIGKVFYQFNLNTKILKKLNINIGNVLPLHSGIINNNLIIADKNINGNILIIDLISMQITRNIRISMLPSHHKYLMLFTSEYLLIFGGMYYEMDRITKKYSNKYCQRIIFHKNIYNNNGVLSNFNQIPTRNIMIPSSNHTINGNATIYQNTLFFFGGHIQSAFTAIPYPNNTLYITLSKQTISFIPSSNPQKSIPPQSFKKFKKPAVSLEAQIISLKKELESKNAYIKKLEQENKHLRNKLNNNDI